MPLGFKNGTDGRIQTAINGMKAASAPQTFLGIDESGHASAVTTNGNTNCHVVLRGGIHGTNFDAESVHQTELELQENGFKPAIMIDCSHENSAKNPSLQPDVLKDVLRQIKSKNLSIFGAMIESNLQAGKQAFPQPKENLNYGLSITDGCIDWQATEKCVYDTYEAIQQRGL